MVMNIREMLGQPTEVQRIQESQLLTEEGQTYFNQVLTEYQLLTPCDPPLPDEAQVRKIADGIVAKQVDTRTWGDLFGLEIAVVKLQCDDSLRRGAWAIRAKYKDLVGEKTYDAYQTSNPPDPRTADVKQLRSDTLQILGEFHWAYAFAPLREKIRSDLMKRVFAITTILVLVALLIAGVGYYQQQKGDGEPGKSVQIPVLAVVIALGMIGGYTSLQQRIQNVPSTGDPIVNISELANSRFSLYLAPISGAVFAVLLYIIFIGGLLSGPLFPKVSTLQPACAESADTTASKRDKQANVAGGPVSGGAAPEAGTSNLPQVSSSDTQGTRKPCSESVDFSAFLKKTGPESGVSFAMLLVWSFIAGFAERFVPDTIDRLVSQAAKK
jgi:hypothetical protein